MAPGWLTGGSSRRSRSRRRSSTSSRRRRGGSRRRRCSVDVLVAVVVAVVNSVNVSSRSRGSSSHTRSGSLRLRDPVYSVERRNNYLSETV